MGTGSVYNNYTTEANKVALKKEETRLQNLVASNLIIASTGFADGVEVRHEVQFGSVAATVGRIVDACQRHVS